MRDYFHSNRIEWPEHWTNGGTGITKFEANRRWLYEAAIEKSGRGDLLLKGNELHGRGDSQNLFDFWRIFRELEAQHDPDHLNPDKGGNRAADDYWK